MKRRTISSGLAIILALTVLLSAGLGTGFVIRLRAADAPQAAPLPDLQSLLNHPNDVSIVDLAGPQAEQVIQTLVNEPEAVQLRLALNEAGYMLDLGNAEAMHVTMHTGLEIDAVVVPTLVRQQRLFLPLILKSYTPSAVHLAPQGWGQELMEQWSPESSKAYLVAMVAEDGTSFFQAHKTNLDPHLAAVPDPAIIVNGMPYFYITTLHVVDGRIIYWRYWWYEAGNHPNWYYAYYLHYWDYYLYGPYDWPWWYHWAYGWYYWRFWNYWSAWFPW
jgi:hypothetical protein